MTRRHTDPTFCHLTSWFILTSAAAGAAQPWPPSETLVDGRMHVRPASVKRSSFIVHRSSFISILVSLLTPRSKSETGNRIVSDPRTRRQVSTKTRRDLKTLRVRCGRGDGSGNAPKVHIAETPQTESPLSHLAPWSSSRSSCPPKRPSRSTPREARVVRTTRPIFRSRPTPL
jgi:hypothetical protein